MGFPTGDAARARLLLSGPGRQDLTGEFGLDLGVPGLHSARYPGVSGLRQGRRGRLHPLSVPPLFRTPGLALQNWSGSEASRDPWLERLQELLGAPLAAVRSRFGLPDGDPALARRALLLDLRNLGTLGLQQDGFAGLLWADAIYGHIEIDPGALAAIPRMYVASDVRQVLADAASAQALPRPPVTDAAAVARGRALFSDRVVGVI